MNKLIFGDIEVSKKEFYEGKKAVNLGEVSVDKIVVGNKSKEIMKQVKFLLVIWMILVVLLRRCVLFYHK